MLPNVWIHINELHQFFMDPPYSIELKDQSISKLNELIETIKFNNLDNKAGHIVSFLTNEIDKIESENDYSELIRELKSISTVLKNYFTHFTA